MRTRIILGGIVMFGLSALLAQRVLSQDKGGDKLKIPDPGSEMDRMMKECARLVAPGPQHKALTPLIGDWTCIVRVWGAPGAPPEESKGTMERHWILDNHYIQETYEGTLMNQPFKGLGVFGYDNLKRQYFSVWFDTMLTSYVAQSGQADSTGRVITMTGKFDDPMTRTERTMKSVLRIESDSKHVFETFDVGPDGKEVKTMEIVATRR
jgi:hypothetical protein